MNKVPLQYYQFVTLDEAFHQVKSIPVDDIARYMYAFLPPKYSCFENAQPLSKDLFMTEIIQGGSCAYEALINASYRANCPEMGDLLRNTMTNVFYRWLWIWSEDNSIMKRGKSWFVSREACLQQGRRKTPSYTTWDGPDSPLAQVSVEAVCPCRVHRVANAMILTPDMSSAAYHSGEEELAGAWGQEMIAPPCACFYPHEAPAYTKKKKMREGELYVDGMTITRTPFQLDNGVRYIIRETGENFSSLHRDIYAAYMERKRRLINCSLGR